MVPQERIGCLHSGGAIIRRYGDMHGHPGHPLYCQQSDEPHRQRTGRRELQRTLQRGQHRHADHDDRWQSQCDDVHQYRQFVVGVHRRQRKQRHLVSGTGNAAIVVSGGNINQTLQIDANGSHSIANSSTINPGIRLNGNGSSLITNNARPSSTAASRAPASAPIQWTIPVSFRAHPSGANHQSWPGE